MRKLIKHLNNEILTFIGLTLASILILIVFVNLQPQVDEDFFFSSDDPQFQSEHEISKLFIRKDTQLIISATGPIDSPEYMTEINRLTQSIRQINGVTGVKSLSNGPKNLEDAMASPLWKRLLISDDKKSTNLIVLIQDSVVKEIVAPIENVIEKFSSENFRLNISGLPYVIELIRRNLVRDIAVFSTLAFIIFGLVIFFVFRSKAIVAGTMISCLNACMWTFMITDLFHIPIGILTANLATIIFVLTLTHMVFITFNWKTVCKNNDSTSPVDTAVKMTFPASFWSMLTTLLGFLSLLSVPAKPLRELGAAGAIGAFIAITVAYGIYPSFLKLTQKLEIKSKKRDQIKNNTFNFLEQESKSIKIIIVMLFIIAIPGLWMMNTDPSMLSFFSKKSEIHKGLQYIDRNGGSSPLIIVVRSEDEALLNSQSAYEKLWNLQTGLEKHRAVGSVVSLPVLMAEAKQEPLAFFLVWDWLLDILEKPQYDEIAKSFVTPDRKYGLFLLRMNESNRVQSRLTIIEEVKEIVKTHAFVPEITGGVYNLQGHLSKLVVSSLIFGLGKLILLFAGIAWFISRSVRIAGAMTLSIFIIPICILGFIGLYRIPLDVISSPAPNVAIAMGIDAMIHMVNAYRRKKTKNNGSGEVWSDVRQELWKPVMTSTAVITLGFGIFFFSTFPPTQRFGVAIVFGTLIASFIALYIMPQLITLKFKKEENR